MHRYATMRGNLIGLNLVLALNVKFDTQMRVTAYFGAPIKPRKQGNIVKVVGRSRIRKGVGIVVGCEALMAGNKQTKTGSQADPNWQQADQDWQTGIPRLAGRQTQLADKQTGSSQSTTHN